METQTLVQIADLGIMVDRYLGIVGQQQAVYVLAFEVNPEDGKIRHQEFRHSLEYLEDSLRELRRLPLQELGLDTQALERLSENLDRFKALDNRVIVQHHAAKAKAVAGNEMLLYNESLPLIGSATINMGFFNRSITNRMNRVSMDSNELVKQTVNLVVVLGIMAVVLGVGGCALLFRTVRHQRLLVTRLNQLSSLDGLTGLDNRRSWDTRAPVELERAQRTGKFAVLAVIDLDHFKDFNDAHGHLAGDERLRAFAQGLQNVSRGTDLVARYGGEEFVVLLPDCSVESAQDFLRRVRQQLPEVAFSAGVTPTSGFETLEEVMARADAAMYQAKSAGRDRVVVMKLEDTRGKPVSTT